MLNEQEFFRLVLSWREEKGIEINGRKCIPLGPERLGIICSLIKHLKEVHNCTAEDLDVPFIKRTIVEASINRKAEKAAIWAESVRQDFDRAIAICFPVEIKQ